MSEIEPNAAGPDPDESEEEAPLERRREEEATRYPGHDDPEGASEPDTDQDG